MHNMLLVRGITNSKFVNITDISLNINSAQPCHIILYKDIMFYVSMHAIWSAPVSCVRIDDSTRATVLGGVMP